MAAVVVVGAALLALDLGSATHETSGGPAAVLIPQRRSVAHAVGGGGRRSTVGPVHRVGIHLRTAGAPVWLSAASIPAF